MPRPTVAERCLFAHAATRTATIKKLVITVRSLPYPVAAASLLQFAPELSHRAKIHSVAVPTRRLHIQLCYMSGSGFAADTN